MAAKGLVPMQPPVLATALTFFLGDADEEIREAAQKSLLEMPDNMIEGIVKGQAHPKTLDFFAKEKTDHESIIENILLNRSTTDDTFLFLAERTNERHANMIAQNQVRLLRSPAIAEKLKKNPNALKSTLDTMVSFLRINGVNLQGESPELTRDEINAILQAEEPTGPESLPETLVEEMDEDDPEVEQKKQSLYQLVQNLTVSEKVKLALKGNKEARGLLIKDSNKIVSSSVVKSPKITEQEILAIAQMRSVNDEVIRIIARTPDWTRNYTLQVALANNPKTPFPVALKFVRVLHISDLQKIAKNKNVSSQLQKLAKELYNQKRK